ncbi:MAG TPA: hypothetical protein VF665_23285 [Longimicrobium sp.]|jgi:hypothetical protein|uniref:hypothetical protein n=1 Tax=Longimicrobium sp. TaxID=2029185 RepID=UPI002EDA40C8
MPVYYYGTVPVLAWIINHFLYGGVHYAWVAAEFHPAATNPKSSNPYMIYADLYLPWLMRDRHDHAVKDIRRSLAGAVTNVANRGRIDAVTAARLRRICMEASMEFFYPVVYRVDLTRIDQSRRVVAGSGLEGSREVLVPDLREDEFDLLFADNRRDESFGQLVGRDWSAAQPMDGRDVLGFLEDRSAA